MFNCDNCGTTTQPTTRCRVVPVETRSFQHPYRNKAHRIKIEDKWEYIDDPGGRGTQITKEKQMCPDCYSSWATTNSPGDKPTIDILVQINGKICDKITVTHGTDENTVLMIAEGKVKNLLANRVIRKRLYVPNKFANIVVGD